MLLSVDTAAAFDGLSIEEMQAECLRLASVLDAAHGQRVELFALVERRKAEAGARLLVGGMSLAQKDALATVLSQDAELVAASPGAVSALPAKL